MFGAKNSNADALYVHFVILPPLTDHQHLLYSWRIPIPVSSHVPPHEDATMVSEPTLSSLAQLSASASANGLVSAPSESTSVATKTKEQLWRHYVRRLDKVVDESDVVLLVLDARDPAQCRSQLIEEEVRRREAEGKRLVFVLNKIGTCASP
jgi:hypothetical protein